MHSILDNRKERERERFLQLSPLQRAEAMHRLLSEIISLRAEAEGVPEHEIYQRYLQNNPRHYQRAPR